MSPSNTVQTLQATNLSVGYAHKAGSKKILSDLNLQISSGEFICLLGPNGTGKSTLIRTLAGLQKSLSGALKIDNHSLTEISPRQRARQLSIVFTDPIPMGRMTAQSFVALGRHPFSGWLGGLSSSDEARIHWALQSVGASTLAERQIAELSDGERQKVSIARALAQEARLMLLDEPTAFLDLPRRVEFMHILRNLSRKESIGMLLSTHDLDLALRFADRLWLITPNGELIQGPPEELALNGELERSFSTENLDWDREVGTFRTHKNPSRFATLSGTGPEMLWTQRALQRLGYGVNQDTQNSEFSIQIITNEENTIWKINHKQGQQNFENIEQLLAVIQPAP